MRRSIKLRLALCASILALTGSPAWAADPLLDSFQAPPSVAKPYREYVEEQERVLGTDEAALKAAREGDSAGVEAARADRDSGDANREELAREIGFEVCSTPRN